jgi:hypothetical protein
MPPRKRNLHRARIEFSTAHMIQLATGSDILSAAWRTDWNTLAEIPEDIADEMRECWEQHGAEITAEHIVDHPGCRPWAMWLFDLLPVEPLRKIRPDYPHDESMRPPSPHYPHEACGYESSFAYLSRRGLLTPQETKQEPNHAA